MCHLSGWGRRCVHCLRRSGFAQAGRPLAVLMYSSVRSARPSGCGLPFGMTQGRTGRAFLRKLRTGFEHSTYFALVGFGYSFADEMAKFLKYSTAPLFLRNDDPFIRCRDILHNTLAKSGLAEHAIIVTEDIGIPGRSGG